MAKYITSIERIGRVEGKRETIQYLLTRRFGPLPPTAAERVAQAKREQLEWWTEQIDSKRPAAPPLPRLARGLAF